MSSKSYAIKAIRDPRFTLLMGWLLSLEESDYFTIGTVKSWLEKDKELPDQYGMCYSKRIKFRLACACILLSGFVTDRSFL